MQRYTTISASKAAYEIHEMEASTTIAVIVNTIETENASRYGRKLSSLRVRSLNVEDQKEVEV